MLGDSPSPPVSRHPNALPSVSTVALVAAVAMLVTAFMLAGTMGYGGPVIGALTPSSGPGLAPAGPPPLTLTGPVANNTTVDIGMAFNLTVNVTGGSGNGSNYNYTWMGLPTGCANNWSSSLNCTPTGAGTFPVTVFVKDTSDGVNATSAALPIIVNALPTSSAFTVSSHLVAPSDHVNVTVNSTIWFNVTAAGGTAPLTYVYAGLPLGCSNRNASFFCQPNRVGVYNVTVLAMDAYGATTELRNVTVTVTAAPITTSSGIGTTGWAIVIGILVVGVLVTMALLLQARREERAGRMNMDQPPQRPPGDSGGSPPAGGSPPPPGPAS